MNSCANVVRPVLFHLDAEMAHHGTVEAFHWLGKLPGVPQLTRFITEVHEPSLRIKVAGRFVNRPRGLPAGWDKSGRALRMTEFWGFGFSEIGSISTRPSMANPRPRLFRLPVDRAIIVNYGQPNDGAEIVAQRLTAHRPRQPLGVNIVKTNDGTSAPPASDEDILADYVRSVSLLHPHAGYLSLNLSYPNAKGGKDFFARRGSITRLLERLTPMGITCPVFLKIAPRDDPAEHERVIAGCDAFSFIRGFCFNLAQAKPHTLEFTRGRENFAQQAGAVAGKPAEKLINRCIAGLYTRMDRQRDRIIGSGGVFTAEDAHQKIRLGASLVQLYTALIYEGTAVVKKIKRCLARLLERDGLSSIAAAVGSAHTSASNS